jgi:hypothetical protein
MNTSEVPPASWIMPIAELNVLSPNGQALFANALHLNLSGCHFNGCNKQEEKAVLFYG